MCVNLRPCVMRTLCAPYAKHKNLLFTERTYSFPEGRTERTQGGCLLRLEGRSAPQTVVVFHWILNVFFRVQRVHDMLTVDTTKSKAKAKSKPKSKSGLVPNLVPGTSEACSSSLKLWKPVDLIIGECQAYRPYLG